mmetsp:Transcript_25225/g.62026  ORF Transcript_25225/g.62026 Transcript_25225/m.62026 type:complete len:148 (-) Transcript_25225:302-745(-)
MLRVLRPGGRIVLTVWRSSSAYADLADLLERVAGKAAAECTQAPFSMGDEHLLEGLFRDAGFCDVKVSTHEVKGRFPSLEAMVNGEVHGWLPVMGVTLDQATAAQVLAEAPAVLRPFINEGDGSVEFQCDALLVEATAPDAPSSSAE